MRFFGNALRHATFRRFWCALALSSLGTWLQIVALAVVMLRLGGGRPRALGVLALLQAGAFLLAWPFAGAFVDRHPPRRILEVTQLCMMVSAATLAVLCATGRLDISALLAVSFLHALALAVDQPARGAWVAQLVPRDDLSAAASLQSVLFQLSSAVGPVLAALILSRANPAVLLALNAVSYGGVLFVVVGHRDSWAPRHPEPVSAPPRSSDSRPALLAFLRRESEVARALLLLSALLFVGPSPALLAPIVAATSGPMMTARLGPLLSAFGIGALAALAMMAPIRRRFGPLAMAIGAASVWAVALAALSSAPSVYAQFGVLLVMGMGQALVAAGTFSLIQERAPGGLRGRLLSLYSLLIMGVRPLGDLPASLCVEWLGLPLTLRLCAGIVLLVAALLTPQGAGPGAGVPPSRHR